MTQKQIKIIIGLCIIFLFIFSIFIEPEQTETKVSFDFENVFNEDYNAPDDLYYVFLKGSGFYESQSLKEHFKRNGYLATDIATNNEKIYIYAPSYMRMEKDDIKDEEREYQVKIVKNHETMGLTLELYFKDDPRTSWAIGHLSEIFVKDDDIVKTGYRIARSGGCPQELLFEEKSTGCHTHIEYRKDGKAVPYPEYMYGRHGEELQSYREWKKKQEDWKGRIERGESLAWDDPRYSSLFVSAIHNAENGRCAKNCKTSPVGAKGAFQFMPRTWKAYGCDGNNDGKADVNNLEDALCGAKNYLSTLYHKEKEQCPSCEERWIYFRSAARYNSGYKYKATHNDLPQSVINYANKVLLDMGFSIE